MTRLVVCRVVVRFVDLIIINLWILQNKSGVLNVDQRPIRCPATQP